jgi:hypothetical protein
VENPAAKAIWSLKCDAPGSAGPLSNRFRSMVLARYVCTLYIRVVAASMQPGGSVRSARTPGSNRCPVMSGQGDGVLTDSFHPSRYNGNDRARRSADLAAGLNHQAVGEDHVLLVRFPWAEPVAAAPGPKPHQEEQRASSDVSGNARSLEHRQADVAQLVEQLIRNQ